MGKTRQQTALTLRQFKDMKQNNIPITCLSVYDATFSGLCDEAGIHLLLVGDSLGMVMQGHANTVPVSLDDIIYHSQCVMRSAGRAFVVADMPFMTTATVDTATQSAARLMREAQVGCIKLEVGPRQIEVVGALHANGVPVCAHLGLRPQWIHQIGELKCQAKTAAEQKDLYEMALAVVEQGAQMIVLECVPAEIAKKICSSVDVPVIGIGVGEPCDGQILVVYDILGIGRTPHFAKDFLAGQQSVAAAVKAYAEAVKNKAFPET